MDKEIEKLLNNKRFNQNRLCFNKMYSYIVKKKIETIELTNQETYFLKCVTKIYETYYNNNIDNDVFGKNAHSVPWKKPKPPRIPLTYEMIRQVYEKKRPIIEKYIPSQTYPTNDFIYDSE